LWIINLGKTHFWVIVLGRLGWPPPLTPFSTPYGCNIKQLCTVGNLLYIYQWRNLRTFKMAITKADFSKLKDELRITIIVTLGSNSSSRNTEHQEGWKIKELADKNNNMQQHQRNFSIHINGLHVPKEYKDEVIQPYLAFAKLKGELSQSTRVS